VTTVDRLRWIEERLRFLQERLDTGVADDERSTIESEMESLHKEAGFSSRWFRRLLGWPRSATGRWHSGAARPVHDPLPVDRVEERP
jgi:hypothetical protein